MIVCGRLGVSMQDSESGARDPKKPVASEPTPAVMTSVSSVWCSMRVVPVVGGAPQGDLLPVGHCGWGEPCPRRALLREVVSALRTESMARTWPALPASVSESFIRTSELSLEETVRAFQLLPGATVRTPMGGGGQLRVPLDVSELVKERKVTSCELT